MCLFCFSCSPPHALPIFLSLLFFLSCGVWSPFFWEPPCAAHRSTLNTNVFFPPPLDPSEPPITFPPLLEAHSLNRSLCSFRSQTPHTAPSRLPNCGLFSNEVSPDFFCSPGVVPQLNFPEETRHHPCKTLSPAIRQAIFAVLVSLLPPFVQVRTVLSPSLIASSFDAVRISTSLYSGDHEDPFPLGS